MAAKRPDFLAFAGADDSAALKAFAALHGWDASSIHEGDIVSATEFLKANPSPHILLVEVPSREAAPGLIDALADVCEPGTKVIITGHINEYSFYVWLTEIGIFNYLLKPLNAAALEGVFQKAQAPAAPAGITEKPPATVIAVAGARGGVGASTIALNLAGIIAENPALRVALVDADPQDGSIALSLDIEPSRGLRDALERPERIDGLFIERVMSKLGANLSILSAEENLHDKINTHDDATRSLLAELQERFDVVVFDVGRLPSAFSRQCLLVSNKILLTADLSLLSLRDTLRLSDLMREHFKLSAPLMVANRVGLASKQMLAVEDFEKGVSAKFTAQIPFAPELFMEVGAFIPAVKNKTHAAGKPLRALAAQLVPQAGKPAAKESKGFSLFSKRKKE